MSNYSKLYFIGLGFILATACTPAFSIKLVENRSSLPDSTKVLTYFSNDRVDGDIEILGNLSVNIRSLTTCDSDKFNERILNEIRKAGGNSLILNRYITNKRRLKNCRELEGDISYINYNIDSTLYNENFLKTDWEIGFDDIEGVYESIGPNLRNMKFGVHRERFGELKLIHLGGISETFNHLWEKGNIRAELKPTGATNTYKAVWLNENRTLNENYIFSFRAGVMTLINSEFGFQQSFIKIYPTEDISISSSGSGFAISNQGYIVTNYHVIEGAKHISVKGVNGDFSTSYKAQIVLEDLNNDLAILKVDLPEDKLLNIPFNLKESLSEVGEEVYVLGYPLRTTMGDEVKLTNGVISSKTGFRGDVTLYQVSASTHPGNSGGPLFDTSGNLVGIVSSKHPIAESTSYAVKVGYLKNLLAMLPSNSIDLDNSSLKDLTLTEKIEALSSYVYIIERE